jgi:hypothetical protein
MQALPGHNRVEVGMLAEWAPVGLAEGRTSLFAALAPGCLAIGTTAEAPAIAFGLGGGGALIPIVDRWPGDHQWQGPLTFGLGHGHHDA